MAWEAAAIYRKFALGPEWKNVSLGCKSTKKAITRNSLCHRNRQEFTSETPQLRAIAWSHHITLVCL